MQNIYTYPLPNHFAWHPIRPNVTTWSISCVLLLHGLVLWAALGASQEHQGDLKQPTPARIGLILQSHPPRTELALTRPETRPSDQLGLTESSVSPDTNSTFEESSPSESALPTKSLVPKERSSPPAPVTPNRRSPQKSSANPSNANAPVASPSQPANTTGRQTATPALASPSSSYHCPTPEYPTLSRRLKEEGVVTLKFLLGVGGQILKTEIAQTSGFIRLDHAALSALSRCQFHPVAERHPAHPRWAIIDYLWKLKK